MREVTQQQRPKKQDVHGWVILDKPVGMTSTYAVSVVKRAFRAKKAGHAGTLDPLASGVLPIALGEATKTVPFIVDGQKMYRFTIRWGSQTNTDDMEGQVIAQSEQRPDRVAVEALLPQFTGSIEQIPPQFSAIKIKGERAYDLARGGEQIELQPRLVEIDSICLLEHTGDESVLSVECGKGTYIRAIARDMGRLLGCYGHVTALRRVVVRPFCEDQAVQVSSLETDPYTVLQSVEAALAGLPHVIVSQDQAQRLMQGQSTILRGHDAPDSGTVYATSRGRIIAIGDVVNGELHPNRVFNLSGIP